MTMSNNYKVEKKKQQSSWTQMNLNLHVTEAVDEWIYTSNGNPGSSFRLNPVDCNNVISTVTDLTNSNCYSSDGILVQFIRDSLPVIAF